MEALGRATQLVQIDLRGNALSARHGGLLVKVNSHNRQTIISNHVLSVDGSPREEKYELVDDVMTSEKKHELVDDFMTHSESMGLKQAV